MRLSSRAIQFNSTTRQRLRGKNAPRRNHAHSGFALVVTVSLMILLTLLAVGMLSLSAISLRGAGQSTAISEARANARLAMMLALGELQKQAGPDQRITANGSIVSKDAVHPHWTGVWDSWKAGADTSADDEPSAHATLSDSDLTGMAPTYESHRSDHFRRWLVSDFETMAPADVQTAVSRGLEDAVSPGADAKSVTLVSEGSVPDAANEDKVLAGLVGIEGVAGGGKARRTGRFGWWVGDESGKARVKEDSYEKEGGRLSDAMVAFRQQAPARPSMFPLPGFSKVEEDAPLELASTRRSIELIEGAGVASGRSFHHATPFSKGLLVDVREGGLKRDLSAILERPINIRDSSDEFMLYRFDSRGNERVPIQDLAAYHQLYREHLENSSRFLRGGYQVNNPDFGSGSGFTREYSNLYRQPVPIRLQYLLSLLCEPRTPAEMNANKANKDPYKLHVGITPAITFWNPNNVPLAMNLGPDVANQFRFFNMPFTIRWTKQGRGYSTREPVSLSWLSRGIAKGGDRDTGFTLYTSGTKPIVFEPGQVRVFSLASHSAGALRNSDTFNPALEVTAGWDPTRFIRLERSDPSANAAHIEPKTGGDNGALTFSESDNISFVVEASNISDLANGAALQFFLRQSSLGAAKQWLSRHFSFTSRLAATTGSFNVELMRSSFPDNTGRISFEARSGRDIVRANATGVGMPFLMVNLAAGCETHESQNLGSYAGRRFASRPFLHSSPITGTVFIDRADRDAAYQHGWNWWVNDITSVFDANVSVSPKNEGYYGGGYSVESGTTHVVQQEIPLVPPISIAALSHAHLGGFSIANNKLAPHEKDTVTAFQDVTASGQGGLFPHTVRAIGNSYAHPYLKPDQAYSNWTRFYSQTAGERRVTFADHSYLSNKALWDEYFFSSITPTSGPFFSGRDNSSALVKARNFLFGDEELPNRRFEAHRGTLTEADLGAYYNRNGATGLAERAIAGHLMVEGGFNVNSTSVEAWKALLSSMRKKETLTIDGRGAVTAREIEGSPALAVGVPAGPPVKSGGASSDEEAWMGGRELSDGEIEQLAKALVDEIRERGPFLSLSEFVNRRLDATNPRLSVKGALQAAIDADGVDINKAFRDSARRFTSDEISALKPEFPEALEGPVAIGSSAYVNQADILRGLAAQLTPRGDTFVIRAYGDSLSADGGIAARAWCEAVVQRLPEYIDSGDDAYLKKADLQSPANIGFGRRFQVVSFRYLNPSEV